MILWQESSGPCQSCETVINGYLAGASQYSTQYAQQYEKRAASRRKTYKRKPIIDTGY